MNGGGIPPIGGIPIQGLVRHIAGSGFVSTDLAAETQACPSAAYPSPAFLP
jgi:hypothetical protein